MIALAVYLIKGKTMNKKLENINERILVGYQPDGDPLDPLRAPRGGSGVPVSPGATGPAGPHYEDALVRSFGSTFDPPQSAATEVNYKPGLNNFNSIPRLSNHTDFFVSLLISYSIILLILIFVAILWQLYEMYAV